MDTNGEPANYCHQSIWQVVWKSYHQVFPAPPLASTTPTLAQYRYSRYRWSLFARAKSNEKRMNQDHRDLPKWKSLYKYRVEKTHVCRWKIRWSEPEAVQQQVPWLLPAKDTMDACFHFFRTSLLSRKGIESNRNQNRFWHPTFPQGKYIGTCALVAVS
jgi:hypothetical protein